MSARCDDLVNWVLRDRNCPKRGPLSDRPRLRRVLSALIAVIATAPALCAEISVSRGEEFKTRAGTTISATVVRFAPPNVNVQVLATAGLRPAKSSERAGLSIEAASAVASLRTLSRGDLVIANGGFSGAQVDRPVGLTIAGGNVVSLPDYTIRRGDPGSQCPALRVDHVRHSGVLCVKQGGNVSIEHLDNMDIRSCFEALQAGPMLVDAPGQNGICRSATDDRPYRRTAACTSSDGFALIVTEQPVLLYDLAEWLAAPKDKGGLGCNSALNLSGDSSSGALYRSGGTGAPWRKIGDGTFPLATLIAVGQRPAPANNKVAVPPSQSNVPPGASKAARR